MKYGKLMLVLAVVFVMCLSGCRKPPLVEQFEEVKNNETAFVIQLEGDQQAKLDSLESLRKMQVSTKRINIPLRWQRTGRWDYQGKWIPTVKIIKVDNFKDKEVDNIDKEKVIETMIKHTCYWGL